MLSQLKSLTGGSFDHRIISDLQKGGFSGRKAEDELFTTFSYYIQEGVKKYSMREEDAFDAYSDTVLSAIHTIVAGKFEARSSLKTYLYRVYHHKCVDVIRKLTTNKEKVNRTPELPDMLMYLSDDAKSVVQKLVEAADVEELLAKLQRLGENCRSLLIMFADGFSDKEIAINMEYNSADVVKTSRLRCLQKLRMAYSTMKKT
jgi:RNA polymerase sigma factor (sigma-70 family)